ncbi:GNAT family N-acetyltransferase [Jannaschia seohaensis]|uniref:Protein N-acetyltransferase, RimJ/RimL family n=1 Tax=Jannaschia seohaensis TaxID=475081 RepID=A0A2Y9C8I4_9RHOB|nr:GNAT family N-acetyltransferase [Jannaschia seohaensis]PWJ16190.1 RimJ/RimL family protein N-acetyltransferase [Jannaschia seohaensis]SSA49203.1 Protein N-acetyltransferase, RimJ/RimL family [Jannaschia seohaensis]
MTDRLALTTERLTLRPPTVADWAPYAAFMRTDAARHFAGHRSETAAWRSYGAIMWHWMHLGFGPWAVTETGDDSCVGIVGPKRPAGWPEGEITWIVFAPAAGRGIAAEAARAARRDAYDRLGWTTAVSYIEDGNHRSTALARRLGCSVDAEARLPGGPVRAWRHPAPEVAA